MKQQAMILGGGALLALAFSSGAFAAGTLPALPATSGGQASAALPALSAPSASNASLNAMPALPAAKLAVPASAVNGAAAPRALPGLEDLAEGGQAAAPRAAAGTNGIRPIRGPSGIFVPLPPLPTLDSPKAGQNS